MLALLGAVYAVVIIISLIALVGEASPAPLQAAYKKRS
jgi:hypothetical protein